MLYIRPNVTRYHERIVANGRRIAGRGSWRRTAPQGGEGAGLDRRRGTADQRAARRRVDVLDAAGRGGVRDSERPVAGLRRELREELGAEIVVDGPTDRVWYAHHSRARTLSSYRVYDCAVASSVDPNPAEGTLDARWVPADELPPRTLPRVRSLLECHPELPT